METLGQILFYSAFIAPLLINIIVMKYLKFKTWVKLLIGFVISVIVIAALLLSSIQISLIGMNKS